MLITVILACIVLLQGGFYPVVYVLAGGIFTVLTVIFSKKIVIDKITILLISLTLLYFLSTGLNKTSLYTACFPLSVLTYYLFLAGIKGPNRSEKIFDYICIFTVIYAGIMLVLHIFNFQARMHTTFQYANTAGIFFAAIATIMPMRNKKIAKFNPIIQIALLFTMSVGAITLYALGFLYLNKNKISKKLFLIFSSSFAVGIFLFRERLLESSRTFIERIIHIMDGWTAMSQNILLGIGPGKWEISKGLYQSAQYDATKIHSSFMQIGVDAGIFALIISLTIAFFLIKDKGTPNIKTAIAVLLVHGIFDFSFSFLAIPILIFTLYISQNEPGGKEFSKLQFTTLLFIPIFALSYKNVIENRNIKADSEAVRIIKQTEYLISLNERGKAVEELLNGLHLYKHELSLYEYAYEIIKGDTNENIDKYNACVKDSEKNTNPLAKYLGNQEKIKLIENGETSYEQN